MSRHLLEPLAASLPQGRELLFLQSCLLEGDHLRRSWESWWTNVGDPLDYLVGPGRELRGHLPLLYRNLTAQGVAIPRSFEPYLRAAVLRARLRHEILDRCRSSVLEQLHEASVEVVVLRGHALAIQGHFAQPWLRHCHDLDLWVLPQALSEAERALAARGHHRCWTRWGSTRMEHPEGLPVMLHSRLVHLPVCPLSAIVGKGIPLPLARTPMRALPLPQALLHILAHAATCRRRPHHNWVMDACAAIPHMRSSDWQRFLDDAQQTDLALSVTPGLEFLRSACGQGVSEEVVTRMKVGCAGASRRARFLALEGARRGRPGGLRNLLAPASWLTRVRIVGLLAAPPFSYLRWRSEGRAAISVLLDYGRRPLRQAWNWLRRNVPAREVPAASRQGEPARVLGPFREGVR